MTRYKLFGKTFFTAMAAILIVIQPSFSQNTKKVGWSSIGDVGSEQTIQTHTLTRDKEPVILTGNELSEFIGADTSDIFVYAFSDGSWLQIPFQIDERDSTGSYFAQDEISGFDANDELVFLTSDLGDQVGPNVWLDDASTQSFVRYEVEVVDGTNSNNKGWAYIFRSNSLSITADMDYVSVVASGDSVFTTNYAAGYASGDNKIFDYLKFTQQGGGTNVDILDRQKFRVRGRILQFVPFRLTEDDFAISINSFKDGRVRALLDTELSAIQIVIKLTQIFYPSLFSFSLADLLQSIDEMPGGVDIDVTEVRLSFDLNENAIGMTYFDENSTQGVIVDGIRDSINDETSFWAEVTGEQGTMLRVTDFTFEGGSASTYYLDDAGRDEQDTGDKRSYGDSGIKLINPDSTFSISNVALFLLPGNIGNVGEQYAGYVRNPLQTTTREQTYESSTPGDVNTDGDVTVQDLIKVINFILGTEDPTPKERIAADINGDGVLDVSDLIGIINIILGIG